MFGSLALGETLSSQAGAVVPTWRPISPGKVLRLAHQQAIGRGHRAPQGRACAAQIGTVLRILAEGQSALVVSVVDAPGQRLRERLGSDGLVQQTLAVAVVQEGGDHQGGAGRPRLLLVKVRQRGRHHVRPPVGAVDLGAQLGVIVGHIEDMACRRTGWDTLQKS